MINCYDRKYLIKCLLILLGVAALMNVTGGVGFVVVAPLILLALLMGRYTDLLFYLVMTGTMVIGNSNVMPKSSAFFIVQRAILAVLAGLLGLQVFGRRTHPVLRPLYLLIIYLVFMIVPSNIGWCPIISYLKLSLFSICFFAYFGVAARLTSSAQLDISRIRSIMLAFAIFYILGSVALIPFPAFSQLRGQDYLDAIAAGRDMTSLFTGMANHSQSLGPVITILCCILIGDLFFGMRRWDKLYVLLLVCCPILIYKTSSRTAAGTFLITIFVQLYFLMRMRSVGSQWKSRIISVGMLLLSICVIVVLFSSSTQQSIMKYALKTGEDGIKSSDVTIERITSSRQGLMDTALANFKKSPMIGNGFQVAEYMIDTKMQSFKQSLSAPIEKGVWITAVLEEGGVVGFSLFTIFIVGSVVSLIRRGAYIGCGLLIAFLLFNFGEFTFFSMSYTGGFAWAMVFLGLILDIARIRAIRNLNEYSAAIMMRGRAL